MQNDLLHRIQAVLVIDLQQTNTRDSEVLGEGGYGSVFRAEATDKSISYSQYIRNQANCRSRGIKTVAVKCEKYSRSMLHIEVAVLKAAKNASVKHLCELYDYVSHEI